jgi:hypothetical protein
MRGDRELGLGAHITFRDTAMQRERHREGREAEDQREHIERVDAHNNVPLNAALRVVGRSDEPRRDVGLCAGSPMPRQCEEVALPEQAINRGHERYHRGGRMQAEYPDPIGAWLVHSCSASRPAGDGGDVAQAPHAHSSERRRIGAGPTTRRRRAGPTPCTFSHLPKSPCRRAANSALSRPKSLQVKGF